MQTQPTTRIKVSEPGSDEMISPKWPEGNVWPTLTRAAFVLCVMAGVGSRAAWADGPAPGAGPRQAPILSFELNEGQVDADVRFVVRHGGMTTIMRGDELVTSFTERDREPVRGRGRELADERGGPHSRRDALRPQSGGTRTHIRMRLRGGRAAATAVGLDPLPGKTHYFKGNDPKKWRRNVTNYRSVKVPDVYPGVDLVLHGESGQLEYDFVVAAGADAGAVDLEIEGALDSSVDAKGDLLLRTSKGQLRHVSPESYQEADGRRSSVQSRFVARGQRRWGFEVGNHDRRRPLVIDPVIIYSTITGGSLDDSFLDVAADGAGNSYAVSETESADFPGGLVGGQDGFVQKRSPEGVLIYSAIIGGTGWEWCRSVAADLAGRAYVAGYTYSQDFPVQNAYQDASGGDADAFLVRLAADGSDLEYSTYVGGEGGDSFLGVAVDGAGYVYVGGSSSWRSGIALIRPLPETHSVFSRNPFQYGGGLLGRFRPDGRPDFLTPYIGGARHLATDGNGNVYVIGRWGIADDEKLVRPIWTGSTGHVGKIDTNSASVVYLTETPMFAEAVAADRMGNAYVVGEVTTQDQARILSWQINACQPSFAGGGLDAYVMKLDREGALVWSTYYGTADYEYPRGIAVGRDGAISIVGYEEKMEPGTLNPVAEPDGFYAQLDATGCVIDSYDIASPDPEREEWAEAVAVDLWGNVYVVGEWNYDTSPLGPSKPTTADAIIIKFEGEFQDLPVDCRDCDQDVGLPVNLFSGSVWLNQTDAAIPGVVGLDFTRSYNSVGQLEPTWSAFGPGWTHPFEQNLAMAPAGLRLRQGNGVPMMFASTDGVTFRASAPANETSWIVKSGETYTRHFRQGGSEDYDAMGRLAVVRDAVGNETTLTWSDLLLTGVRDPGGRELTLAYAGNRIHSLSGPAGIIASYGYGFGGFLQTVTYADHSGYSFAYDGAGRLIRVEDLAGRTLESHTYDPQGRALTSEVADGVEKMTLEYSPGVTVVTDALENSASYTYASYGGSNKVTLRTGSCVSCGGTETEAWTYYPDGRVHTHRVGSDPASVYTYTAEGDLETVTDPSGRTTGYTYDYDGRMLTRSAPGEGTTTWTQSAAGPLSVTVPVTETEGRTTSFTYTPTGKLETIVDAEGHVTTNVYDDLGDLRIVRDPLQHETTFAYDPMGRRTFVTDALEHTTQTVYDSVGRVTAVKAHDGTTTGFVYNDHGQRTSVKDALGRETKYVYDAHGRLDSVIDADNKITRYGYDAMSQKTAITDAAGRRTSFEYDGQGRLESTTYPGNRIETFTYYPAGRLHTKRDRKGVTTTYEYDAAGRPTRKTYSDGSPDVTFDYDDAGRLGLAANGLDSVVRTYDLAGGLRTEASTRNGTTLSVDYDTVGRRQALKLGQGFGQETLAGYEYDNASRLETITYGTREFGFLYDEANRRSTLTSPNGVVTTYAYDALDRLTSVSAAGVTQSAYTYDVVGNRTTKTTDGLNESYAYDALSRLDSVARDGSVVSAFRYDPVGNRTRSQAGMRVTSATFSPRNELSTETAGGQMRVSVRLSEAGTVTISGVPARAMPDGTFQADLNVAPGSNEFLIEAKDASGNVRTDTYGVMVPGANASYEYDENGNLTSKNDGTNTWGYEWNVENQLVRVTKDGSEVAHFAYDALGRRVEKDAAGVTTRYLYDGDDIVRETLTGGAVYTYVHGPGIDEPLARVNSSGALTYYHADGLGSIVATTDAGGAVTSRRQYDAWGNLEQGADQPGYAFAGREWDPETQLYYYRARYYDPNIGRFISEDPIGFAGGINVFAYVLSNPGALVDPFGLAGTRSPADFGNGWTGAVDTFNYRNSTSFEIHVYNPAGHEVGIVGPNGWAGKHGFTAGVAPEIPESALLKLNGRMIQELRANRLVRPKGLENIKGRGLLAGKAFGVVSCVASILPAYLRMLERSYDAVQAGRTYEEQFKFEVLRDYGALSPTYINDFGYEWMNPYYDPVI